MTFLRTLMIAGCLLATGPAAAEVLVIDHAARTADVSKPQRGLSMADVEARFGSPSEKRAAVGEPPITQWLYPGYTVYFEYDRVIHAVTAR